MALFEHTQLVDLGDDLLKKCIKAFLERDQKQETLFSSLYRTLEATSIPSPESHLLYMRHLSALIWMERDHFSTLNFQPLLSKGKSQGYWKSIGLLEAYDHLATYLSSSNQVPISLKQLEKGAILQESGFHDLKRHFPNPQDNGEMALIYLYLGWSQGNEELLQAALKQAEFCLSLFDSKGALLHLAKELLFSSTPAAF